MENDAKPSGDRKSLFGGRGGTLLNSAVVATCLTVRIRGPPPRRWGWHELDSDWAKRVVADCGVQPGHLVLDVGAGKGSIAAAQLEVGAGVIAIEAHPARIWALRRRFGAQVVIVQADASDLRLPRRSGGRLPVSGGIKREPQDDTVQPARRASFQPRLDSSSGGDLAQLHFGDWTSTTQGIPLIINHDGQQSTQTVADQ